MRDPRDYNISLRQIGTSDKPLFEARVREFPDAIDYAENREEAYELVLETIEASLEVLEERGKRPPEPVEPNDDYSGRITLRVPKTLHRGLAEQADHENISLNQYLVSLLAYHVGTRYTGKKDHYQALGQKAVGHRSTKPGSQPNLRAIYPDDSPANQPWPKTG